jgi:hypothetical protein
MKVVAAHGYLHHFYAVLVRLEADRAVVHLYCFRLVKVLVLRPVRLLLQLFDDARGVLMLYALLPLQTHDAAGTESPLEPAFPFSPFLS